MKINQFIPKFILIAASSWISRGVSAVVQIMSVRYLLDILGQDKYAVFILLSGLLAWCNLSDLGIGNSVLSLISEKRAGNKKYKQLIFSCFVILIFVCVIVALLLWLLSSLLSDFYLKNFDTNIVSNKTVTFFVACLVFCLTTVGGGVYKIWYAEQVGWLSNLYPALASAIGFFGIYFLSVSELSIEYSILYVFLVFFLPAALISIMLFVWKIYRIGNINISLSKNIKIIKILVNRAKPFFLFSVMGVVVLQTDYLILSQKINPVDIVLYAILMKIFMVIYFIYSSVLQAWWPVCTELRIQKQWKKLKRNIIFIVMLGGFAMITLGLGVYYFQDFIFNALNLKNINHVGFGLFALFIFYFIVRVWCDIYAVLLQTMNYMRPLFIIVPIQVVINIVFQWFFSELWGLYGILMGLILSFLLTVVVFLPWCFNKRIKMEDSVK